MYDIVIIGNYTKDTIVSSSGTRLVDGGGFNYGAHVAAMMGLKTAAVTRLAFEDRRVVEALVRIGVEVFPTYTPHSTCLTLRYPGADPDERVLTVTTTAGPFTADQVEDLEARAFLINGSIRGEVTLEFVRMLRSKRALLAADIQAFVRVVSADGTLEYRDWPEKSDVISCFDILKTDAVEAEFVTGLADMRSAARTLANWGPKEIVLTHRDGILVLADDRFYEARFCPDELRGRSGRGDTCIASYVAKRLGASPQEATFWAAAATSLKLEAEGPLKRPKSEVEALFTTMQAGR